MSHYGQIITKITSFLHVKGFSACVLYIKHNGLSDITGRLVMQGVLWVAYVQHGETISTIFESMISERVLEDPEVIRLFCMICSPGEQGQNVINDIDESLNYDILLADDKKSCVCEFCQKFRFFTPEWFASKIPESYSEECLKKILGDVSQFDKILESAHNDISDDENEDENEDEDDDGDDNGDDEYGEDGEDDLEFMKDI